MNEYQKDDEDEEDVTVERPTTKETEKVTKIGIDLLESPIMPMPNNTLHHSRSGARYSQKPAKFITHA
jgi:hypothetical protein